jgi:hypothetical protein
MFRRPINRFYTEDMKKLNNVMAEKRGVTNNVLFYNILQLFLTCVVVSQLLLFICCL